MKWCENYLQNRTFTVKVNDTLSHFINVTVSTAQGSVLGPIHFLSYVNEMSSCIKKSTCYQFADDTCLVAADRNPEVAIKELQDDFDILIQWCHDVGIVINTNKTKLLIIKSSHQRHSHNKIDCSQPQLFTCQR